MSKALMIQEDDNNIVLSSLTDFIKKNHDTMAFEESNKVLRLKVDESCSISTHCGFVTVTRIK